MLKQLEDLNLNMYARFLVETTTAKQNIVTYTTHGVYTVHTPYQYDKTYFGGFSIVRYSLNLVINSCIPVRVLGKLRSDK